MYTFSNLDLVIPVSFRCLIQRTVKYISNLKSIFLSDLGESHSLFLSGCCLSCFEFRCDQVAVMCKRCYAAVEVLFPLRGAGRAGGYKTDEAIVDCLMKKLNIFSARGFFGLSLLSHFSLYLNCF